MLLRFHPQTFLQAKESLVFDLAGLTLTNLRPEVNRALEGIQAGQRFAIGSATTWRRGYQFEYEHTTAMKYLSAASGPISAGRGKFYGFSGTAHKSSKTLATLDTAVLSSLAGNLAAVLCLRGTFLLRLSA